jgi:phospholipid/cholesterol/gamma-HCH transport system substrate-binding protein
MKRQDDFVVGLVVIAAVIVVTGMALWLSRAQLGGRRDVVISRMREVGGAKVGSPVVIRGVEAGHISAITLDEKDGWVIVKVALDKGISLPRDPVLTLSEASLFGQWQATLEQRSAAPPNTEVQAQLDDPGARRNGAIPGAVLPGLGDLSVVAGRIAGDVEAVSKRFGTAFSDSAARELRATIKNINTLSTTLNGTVGRASGNIDKLSAHLDTTIQTIHRAADAIDRTASRIDSSTSSGQLKELVTNARAASEDLREMASRLKKSAGAIDTTSRSLSSTLGRIDSVMAKINRGQGSLGLMVNDPSLYRNADSLLVTMRALAADVKAHPTRYVNVKIF